MTDPFMSAPAARNADPSRPGAWQRLRLGLRRTREGLIDGLAALAPRGGPIDAALIEEIEMRLLLADVGIETTRAIVDRLGGALRRNERGDLDAVLSALREAMHSILEPVEAPLFVLGSKPFVILVVGVNGAGKTTTIGKLAHYFRDAGLGVVLAAGDTFRAAAVEQVQEWGRRAEVPVIAQSAGADSSAVIHDALSAARARGADVLIADTAGRLHTKSNLMEELKKIRRTVNRFDASLPVETLLVVDAGTGQNALAQAREFHEAIGVSGLVLTKLDGTAKGGVVFALAERYGIPIRFIGVGEQIDDLRPFYAADFVSALLAGAE
jgi:fused signal recognition particle receptor